MTRAYAALGDIAVIDRRGVTPSEIKSGSRYVGLEHIESGGDSLSFGTVINGELASNKFAFGPNHILFGKLRPYLNKVVCPDFEGLCSTDILPITVGKRADKRYLLHYLRLPTTVAWATSRATGANLPRLSPSELASLKIPLPPIDEQRRIAAILDKADALRRKRKRALGLLDSLTQSIFLEMFGDPVSNPKRWDQKIVGDLDVAMTYGPRFYNEAYAENGIRIVRITDLSGTGELDFQAMPRLAMEDAEIEIHRSRPGELLFARTGATVGKLALVSEEDPPTIPGAYFIRLRFPDYIEPLFAWFALRCKSVQQIIIEGSRQSAQQNFSGPGLRRLPFILPPRTAQRIFIQQARDIPKMKETIKTQVSCSDRLFSSLQSRAFSGQL